MLVRARRPRPADGDAVWELARSAASLDTLGRQVTPVLLQHFADTSLVAEAEGRVVGFVGAYRPATNPSSLFVWEIDVEPMFQRQGLGTRLLHALIQCPGCAGIDDLHVTVGVSNLAAKRLFEAFARDLDATCQVIDDSSPNRSETMHHEREELLRIGPIRIERALRLERPHEAL